MRMPRIAMMIGIVAALLACVFAAYAKGQGEAKANDPVKLSYFSPDMGRILKEDAANYIELQKRTNTKLDSSFITGPDFMTKLNAMVASGDMPDIVKLSGYDFAQYVPQGVLMPLDDLIAKNGANLKKLIPQDAWDKVTIGGKIMAVPSFNIAGKYTYNLRKDWVDAAKAKDPATLDDLYDTLKKLKAYKPDAYPMGGYGSANNTSTINFMHLFGAYGIAPGIYMKDGNKINATMISSAYQDVLKYVKKLYDEKLIDPESLIETGDQAREKLLRDKTGSFTAWWSIVPTVLMDQYKMETISPGTKWSIVAPIKGPAGQAGMLASTLVGHTTVISTKCKNPTAAIKFLDYLVTDEGTQLAFFGIKGTDWIEKDGKFAGRTDAGNKAFSEKWLDPFSQSVLRVDIVNETYRVNNPSYYVYIDAAAKMPLFYNAFEGIITPEFQTLSADLRKFEDESFIKFVTGKLDIAGYPDYVKQWKDRGGEKVQQSMLKELNNRRAASYTLGF